MTLSTVALVLQAALAHPSDLPGLGTMALLAALAAASSMITGPEPAPATTLRRGR